jgi:hypothetical protein
MPVATYNLDELAAKIHKNFRDVPKTFSGMFYGDNGSGKTKLALEVAAAITALGKKILFVDTSAGWETINNHPDLANSLDGRLSILPFEGESQLNTLAEALKFNYGGFRDSFGSIILDESTTMAQQYLDAVVYGRAAKMKDKEEDKADWPDFNIAGNKWRKTSSIFHSVEGLHVIHVGHFRLDKVRGVEKAAPAYQPKVGDAIQRDLKVIGFCVVNREGEVPVRAVQVVDDQFASAKTRVQYKGEELPPVITQKTLVNAISARYQPTLEITNEPVEVD